MAAATRMGMACVLDAVDLSVAAAETVGIVGESGSGKSLTCRAILRVLPPNVRVVEGAIRLGATDLLSMSEQQMQQVRGSRIAMILQDPMTSLNPVHTIGRQVAEPIRQHGRAPRHRVRERALEALGLVRITAAASRFDDFPHQLSGGMRQRVSGAIAMSCEPRVLIADEPTTALDATVQAEYLALLQDIQRQTGISMIFVTHDLGVVAEMCDRVAVMYAGRIVEFATVYDLFDRPSHPYTQALLDVMRTVASRKSRVAAIGGQPPAHAEAVRGCAFAPRCSHVMAKCRAVRPPDVMVSATQRVSCWRHAQ